MAFVVWLCVIWMAAAAVIILLFLAARRSSGVRRWLFGPPQSAALHQLAQAQGVAMAEPPARQAA